MTKINTKYRSIVSSIPHPESRQFLHELRSIEPKVMGNFLPIVWSKAKGINIYDGYGNKWIDFTSAIVLTNAGHANREIGISIKSQIDKELFHNYCNPSFVKLEYLKRLRRILPSYLDKTFLLTTGSEAVECAIRIMREYGQKKEVKKINIISHSNSFHGRTMASMAAAGKNYSKTWLIQKPPGFYHISFPDCNFCPWGKIRYNNCGRECFNKSMNNLNIDERLIAGVIVETFRGPSATFMPKDYARELRKWTISHKVLLVFDEVQAGFGRTGRWFGFEHYGVKPDLITVGKGMTSSLPMSGVIGRNEILDSVDGLSSTHTGNPLCVVAGLKNIDVIEKNKLVENARNLEKVCLNALQELKVHYPKHIGPINGKGLAVAFYLLNPKTGRIDSGLAKKVIDKCRQLGLLLLPTSSAGTIKIAPPLCINSEALLEGISVIKEVMKKEK